MTIYLSLFSTSHCHLCEQAEVLVRSVAHVYSA
ncbi:MAG: glutaredoxin family protein, partial [Methylotenera sp.]|nr:glutaredoxin family protein [Methylotenera sp.]